MHKQTLKTYSNNEASVVKSGLKNKVCNINKSQDRQKFGAFHKDKTFSRSL